MIKRSLLFAGCLAMAADGPSVRPISDLHATKFENLVLREQLAKQALERIAGEQRALFTDVCRAAGIEAPDFRALMETCAVDLEKRTVTRIEKPAAKQEK